MVIPELDQIYFVDIETVPQQYNFEDLEEAEKELFAGKFRFQLEQNPNITAADLYSQRGGILAEFNKIVCISVSILFYEQGELKHKVKSFYGDDEKQLLQEFCNLLESNYQYKYLCAHNGKEFDFPVIGRRLLINGLPIPKILDVRGKKPWETSFIDTMELWKFGDYKHFTSLKLLAHVFGIPSPKDDIDGSDVARVYYEEKDIERIRIYCEKDTYTLARVFLKMTINQDLDA